MEQAAWGVVLNVNAKKIEFMYFNKKEPFLL